jgi:drug/metabolite transporter (DMT)-like permease
MAMMVSASLCFSGMGVSFRLAMEEGLPIAFVPFARSVFTLALMAPWLLRQGVAGMVTRRPWVMVARCAAGLVTFQSWMYALLLLPLADAVSIAQSRPLWAIPLAALFLSERVRRDRVMAALVGFCGVVIIAQPSGEWSWGMPAALLAGVGGATVFITIKLLSSTEPPMRVIGWYSVASMLFWGPVCALVWVTPSWWSLAMLLLGSGLALMGDWLAANAARRAEAGLLSPMEYIQIPAGAMLGFLIFAEWPNWGLPIGVSLMLAATIYLARSAGRQAR